MDLNLKGRLALISGSTGGIGYAAARELARLGASVAINGRSAERVGEAIARLKGEVPQGDFVGAPGDLAGAEGAGAIIRAVPQADILVNNAGIFEPKPFFDIPD